MIMHGNSLKKVNILLVEDNPADQRLVREALKDGKIANNLHIVDDGVKALQYLRKEGEYASAPVPDLVLLDLNLPRKDGREVLHEVKSDKNLRHIPIAVMTVSADEKDVWAAYGNCANCYIQKPLNFERFTEIVRCIENFWFTIVRLPGKGR
jgi:two-component system response regulator